MKALVVIFEQLVPISGGGTPRTFNIVRSLAERGHQVYVAASFGVDKAEAMRELGAAGVLPLAGVSRMDKAKMRKYAVTYPLNILRVAAYAWRLGPDLILTHNTAAGFAALLGKLLRPRAVTVVDLTDLLFEYLQDYKGRWLKMAAAAGRWMERTAVRRSDRIITISQAMKAILVRDYRARAERIDIVHDGVDTGIFHRHADQSAADLRAAHAPGADHVLIFHGVIDPQDGPELLIEAAPAILAGHPRTRFWMVGDGTAVPGLKARAEAAGLADRFLLFRLGAPGRGGALHRGQRPGAGHPARRPVGPRPGDAERVRVLGVRRPGHPAPPAGLAGGRRRRGSQPVLHPRRRGRPGGQGQRPVGRRCTAAGDGPGWRKTGAGTVRVARPDGRDRAAV